MKSIFLVFSLMISHTLFANNCDLTSDKSESKMFAASYKKLYGNKLQKKFERLGKEDSLRIFDHHLARMHKSLHEGQYYVVEGVLPRNLGGMRIAAFQMQALGRLFRNIYRDTPLESKFKKVRKRFKSLEDQIGAVLAQRDFLAQATTLKADAKAVANLERKLSFQEKKLLELLSEKKWESDNGFFEAITETREVFDKLIEDFHTNDVTRMRIAQALAKELREFHNEPLNMDLLEEGGHEARRRWRWIPIYITALSGYVQITEGNGKAFNTRGLDLMADPAHAQGKYVPKSFPLQFTQPITVSKPYLLMLNWMVGGMGRIKDVGQYVHFVAESYVEEGISRNQKEAEILVRQLAEQNGLDYAKTVQQTTAEFEYQNNSYHQDPVLNFFHHAYKEMMESQLLLNLANEFAPLPQI